MKLLITLLLFCTTVSAKSIVDTTDELNDEFMAKIVQFEGLRTTVYNDFGYKVHWKNNRPIKPRRGSLHICIGAKLTNREIRTGRILIGNKYYRYRRGLSKKLCYQLKRQDLILARKLVGKYVKINLTPNQYRALVSASFNIGTKLFRNKGRDTRFLKYLNRGDIARAKRELMQFIMSKGKVLKGLVKRRKFEVGLM